MNNSYFCFLYWFKSQITHNRSHYKKYLVVNIRDMQKHNSKIVRSSDESLMTPHPQCLLLRPLTQHSVASEYMFHTPYEKRRGHGYTLVHQLLKTPLLSL
jgi:hypothetical protein